MRKTRITTRLRPYQFQAVQKATRLRSFGFFAEPGTGKTIMCLATLAHHYRRGRLKDVMVIGPKVAKLVWERECQKHLSTGWDFDDLGVPPVPDKLNIRYVNPERVWRRPQWCDGWDAIVVDESHMIKKHSSQQSKFIGKLEAKYKYLMTGTPVDHKLIDFWAQWRFARPRLYGTVWKRFQRKWCTLSKIYVRGEPLPYAHNTAVSDSRSVRFLDKMEPYSFSIRKQDVPELEELAYPVSLPRRAAETYRELELESITEHEAGTLSTVNALAKLTRLQQLTTGIFVNDDEEKHFIDDTKLRTAVELIELNDEPAVVFSRFTDDLDRMDAILSRKKLRVGHIRGNRKDDPAGKWDVMLVQVQSGGVAIDLTRSRHAYFLSLPFSYIQYHQAISRVHRSGQLKPVKIWVICAEESVDTVIWSMIRSKVSITDAIFNQLGEEPMAAPKGKRKTAKTKAPEAETETEDKPKKAPRKRPDFGISYLAEALNRNPADIRRVLRSMFTDREKGKSWTWDDQKSADKVVAQLKERYAGQAEAAEKRKAEFTAKAKARSKAKKNKEEEED